MLGAPSLPLAAAGVALTVALAPLPVGAADEQPPTGIAELLLEDHESTGDLDIDLAVTRDAAGEVLGEATVRDSTSGDELEVWTDGISVWWEGDTAAGPTSGTLPARALLDPDEMEANFCFHPVGALVCLAGLAVLIATEGCGHGFGCSGETPPSSPSNVPGGGGGPPGAPGGGGDAEGDGDGDGDGDE